MLRRLFNLFVNRIKDQPQEATTPISYDLDRLRAEIKRLTRPHEMPRRVELCREALKLVERERHPELWAGWHVEWANSLQQNRLGSRADNLEEAIAHYKLALEVYTRQAFPSQWAATINNLALAYRSRIKGERADNQSGRSDRALQAGAASLYPPSRPF